jgi:putative transposase
MSAPDRKALLDRDHGKLSIRGQCRLLGIARSGVYRPAAANDDAAPLLMRSRRRAGRRRATRFTRTSCATW